jgi:plasmid stabilization system protein ParE
MNVVFRAEALADLEEIADFVSQQNPQAATRVVERIHRVIYRTLCTLPLGGRLNPANNAREYAVRISAGSRHHRHRGRIPYFARSSHQASAMSDIVRASRLMPYRFAAKLRCGTLADAQVREGGAGVGHSVAVG